MCELIDDLRRRTDRLEEWLRPEKLSAPLVSIAYGALIGARLRLGDHGRFEVLSPREALPNRRQTATYAGIPEEFVSISRHFRCCGTATGRVDISISAARD